MFVRESQVLEVLVRQSLAERIRTASLADPLRVWIPACGAGAEVYAIGMCLLEQFQALELTPRLRIFATDTDREALAATRAGQYARGTLQGLSTERLSHFFEPVDPDQLRASQSLRSLITVEAHDALRDPPTFSRLDLISLRNMPAHVTPQAAQRLASIAQMTLREDGYLLLPETADAGGMLGLSMSFSAAVPIYRKRASSAERAFKDAPLEPIAPAHEGLGGETETASSTQYSVAAWLRSLNEELAVLRVEQQHAMRALKASNDDLTCLCNTLQVAAVFLDPDRRILRYTDCAAEVLGLRPGDRGRSLAELTSPLIDAPLLKAVRCAITSGATAQREIRGADRRCYLRRVQPLTVGAHPTGTVITWIDITSIKSLHEQIAHVAALEQQRIGQELHDGIQQELAGLALSAQNLSDEMARAGRPAARQEATRLAEGLVQSSREIHALARGLVPVPIDVDGLAPALVELARGTSEGTKLTCLFVREGEARAPDADTATHLYRIAQESVRNAVRHAHADQVTIRLSTHGDLMQLEVCDNGIGMPLPSGMGRGVGLQVMEHRCSLVGGTFAVQNPPGGGTRVMCTLPTPAHG